MTTREAGGGADAVEGEDEDQDEGSVVCRE